MGGKAALIIIAGFSSSRQGSAPLNLAAQVARNTGDGLQREVALHLLEQCELGADARVLDLGCGTGLDAEFRGSE